jgi:hypothetical protein
LARPEGLWPSEVMKRELRAHEEDMTEMSVAAD